MAAVHELRTMAEEKQFGREIAERLFALVNGDNFVINNATMVVLTLVGVVIVGAMLYILASQSGLLNAYTRSGQDYPYADQGYYTEDPDFQTRYKRFAPNGNLF